MAGKKPLFSADAAEEYFSTLLRHYRNNGNDIFERDNEGRHASNQIYSAEYQKYLGMQIAMREVLEYFAKFELGDTAIRQQETVANRNEPLTMDELRQMDEASEPVYLYIFDSDIDSGWQIIKQITDRKIIFRGSMGIYVPIKELGVSYNLYRQKPEEGTV